MNPVNIFSPGWDKADSYGIVGLELSAGISRLGVKVNRMGLSGAIDPAWGGILLAYPTNFHKYGVLAAHGHRVASTMFESTCLPDGWAEVLNTCAAVVVPSRWLVDVFRNSGVIVPIHVVPLGISAPYLKLRRKHNGKRPYTFLAIADRGGRKGWHRAGFAFQQAFGNDINYRLILKSRDPLPIQLTNPNVQTLSGSYSTERLAALYRSSDCMVFPTNGEGFGLPPREFVATGGTAIVTDWGGTADDLAMWGLGIRSCMVPAWKGEQDLEGLGEWAEPDIDHLAELMKTVADNRDHFERVVRIQAQWVADNYRWTECARRTYEVYANGNH